jgi:hypothetical protein
MRQRDDERRLIETHRQNGHVTSEDLAALKINSGRGRLIARRHRLKMIESPDRTAPQPAEPFSLSPPAEAVTDLGDDSTDEIEDIDGDIRGPAEADLED